MSMWQVFTWLHLMLILQNLVRSKPSIWDYQKMVRLNLITIDINLYLNNAGLE